MRVSSWNFKRFAPVPPVLFFWHVTKFTTDRARGLRNIPMGRGWRMCGRDAIVTAFQDGGTSVCVWKIADRGSRNQGRLGLREACNECGGYYIGKMNSTILFQSILGSPSYAIHSCHQFLKRNRLASLHRTRAICIQVTIRGAVRKNDTEPLPFASQSRGYFRDLSLKQ